MLLVGDIGGTKTVLALFETGEQGPRPVGDAIFSSAEHGSLEEILARFLEERSGARIETACFGVAGPVIDGKVTGGVNTAMLMILSAIGGVLAVLLGKMLISGVGILHKSQRQQDQKQVAERLSKLEKSQPGDQAK